MRRLVCCNRTKGISIDFEENDRVVTYSGLESCMLNSSEFCDDDSALSGVYGTDSLDEEGSSCSSSMGKEAVGPGSSFSLQWQLSSTNCGTCESPSQWESSQDTDHLLKSKGKAPSYTMRFSDVDAMREKFAKLLLGEDTSGGSRGISTALALSHAITNLSVSIYGELWRLEPLSVEKKNRWRREMDWLLSPTNYMVELVPSKQNGANGSMLEIMTPKARADIHLTLPALKKLDSMLTDVLDSMVNVEFWYAEGCIKSKGRFQCGGSIRKPSKKRWWLPCPRVPERGLSPTERKRLGFHGKLVHQVLKASKSINDNILLQMPLPPSLKDALPKSGRTSLGEGLYKMISSELISIDELIGMLNLKSECIVLETVNRLEGAIYAWKQKISNGPPAKKLPMPSSLAFMWDNTGTELDRIEYSLDRAESLLTLLKLRFPNLPQSFLDVTKVQFNKDVGYAIIEAYSRVLGSLAFSILSRIGDVLQEDDLNKPSTPVANIRFDFSSDVYLAGVTETPPGHIKRSLMDQMNSIDGRVPNAAAKSLGISPAATAAKPPAAISVGMSPHRSLLLW